MRCVLIPVEGHVPASSSNSLALKAVLKDASATVALFLMASSVCPWKSVGVSMTADI